MNIAATDFVPKSHWGQAVFNPRRVALIGASSKGGKLGNLVMRNLLDGFAGELFPIHPGEKEILGHRVYPTVRDVPEPVDLALVAVPTDAVLHAIEECAQAHAKAAVILTGGFAEVGDEGRTLQNRSAPRRVPAVFV